MSYFTNIVVHLHYFLYTTLSKYERNITKSIAKNHLSNFVDREMYLQQGIERYTSFFYWASLNDFIHMSYYNTFRTTIKLQSIKPMTFFGHTKLI